MAEKCRRCGTESIKGKALVNGWTSSDDFGGDAGGIGCTMNINPRDVKMTECNKCPKCGHSWKLTNDDHSGKEDDNK